MEEYSYTSTYPLGHTKSGMGIPYLFYLPNYCHNPPEKGKVLPLQAWTGPEGSRRLRLPYLKTVST